MNYMEYYEGLPLDSEESELSEMIGFDAGISYLFAKNSSSYAAINANLMMLRGKTTYRGSLIGSGDPIGTIVDKNKHSIMDVDLNYAQHYKMDRVVEFQYGLGIGYRLWRRELSISQIEEYKWFSLRPMVGAKFALDKGVNIGLGFEYQYGIYPLMQEPTLGEFKLGAADIIEITLPVEYKYNNSLSLLFEYIYQEQTIKKSNMLNGYIEPDSTAKNQYLKLGLAFKF